MLKGKNTFVAGGTSGMNKAIAQAYAKAGANVTVISRSQDKVDETVASLLSINPEGNMLGFAVDVREYDKVEEAIKATAELSGKLDIVVSGAAGLFMAPAEKMSANAFKTVIDIDLIGTFHVLRAAFEHANRDNGASFINISAPQSTSPYWGQAHACAAKAGLDMLTKCLGMEWADKGIRVNAIVPGPIEGTGGFDKFTEFPALEELLMSHVPMKKYGKKDDIANMAMFLASEAARYVTGEIIRVDGGQALTGGIHANKAM